MRRYAPLDPVSILTPSHPKDGSFAGEVTLTFGYDDSSLLPDLDERDLVILHYIDPFPGCIPSGLGRNCGWVTLQPTSIDPVANTITVITDTLSPFGLGVAPISVPALGPLGIALLGLTGWRRLNR